MRAVCSRTSVRAPTRSTLGYSIRVGLATLVSGPYGQSVKRFLNSFNFVCCSLYVFGRARRAKPATAHLRGLRTHTHLWVYDVWGCVAHLGPKLCGRLSRLGLLRGGPTAAPHPDRPEGRSGLAHSHSVALGTCTLVCRGAPVGGCPKGSHTLLGSFGRLECASTHTLSRPQKLACG